MTNPKIIKAPGDKTNKPIFSYPAAYHDSGILQRT